MSDKTRSDASRCSPATALWSLGLCLLVCGWLAMNILTDGNKIAIFPDMLTERNIITHYRELAIKPTSFLNSTSPQDRLYLAIHDSTLLLPFSYKRNYYSRRDLEQSGWPVSNHSKCGQELESIIELLVSNPNYTSQAGELAHQLTNYMDSFGKPESGVFANGNNNWMGSYENCLASEPNSIKTRYCVARFRHKSWPDKDVTQLRATINVGLCLPETCDTLAYDRYGAKIELLATYEMANQFKQRLRMESLYCLPDERSPLRQMPISGRIYLVIVGAWSALVIVASCIYDCNVKKNRTKDADGETQSLPVKILRALSIRCAINQFKTVRFRVRYSKGEHTRLDISSLDFLKIIATLFIVYGHSTLIWGFFVRNPGTQLFLFASAAPKAVMSLGLFVDTFYLISGLLIAYNLCCKFTTKQLSRPQVWFSANLMILLRMWPLFALVFWFAHSIGPYTGSGPWWDYGTGFNSMQAICMRDPWWRSVPYLANTHPGSACVPPAYFLAHYVQIALLLPPLVCIFNRLPRFGLRIGLVIFLMTISGLNVALKLLKQSVFPIENSKVFGGFLVIFVEKYETSGYMEALGRLGVVSAGALLGHTLYLYKIGTIQEWPSWLKRRSSLIITIMAMFAIMAMPLVAHIISQAIDMTPTIINFVIGNAVAPPIWSACSFILFIHLTTICNHTAFVRFMGHPFWRIFNKLGFGIFLIHYEVIKLTLVSHEQAAPFGFWSEVFRLWSWSIVTCILIALPVYIMFESPISNLVGLCLAGPSSRQSVRSQAVELETNSKPTGSKSKPLLEKFIIPTANNQQQQQQAEKLP